MFCLSPNHDSRKELESICLTENWFSAWIVTCVGSPCKHIFVWRGATEKTLLKGPFEITFRWVPSRKMVRHAHHTADGTGQTIGVICAKNPKNFTTAEQIGYDANITLKEC